MLGNIILYIFVSCSSGNLFYCYRIVEACLDKPDEWAQVLLCQDALQAGLNKGLAFTLYKSRGSLQASYNIEIKRVLKKTHCK
jgi:hypothetical protein